MPKRILAAVSGAVLTVLAVATAHAASQAVAVANVNMRAGPGTAYPMITTVPAGVPMTTYGCLSDYSWCDVSWGANRGWLAAGYIQVTYQGSPVIVTPAAGPRISLTIVNFDHAYWQAHYVGRPWYGRWGDYHRTTTQRAGGVVCGSEACRYGTVRRGPLGTTTHHGVIERD
ncbi:SH3 domain-containing protein [Inquilinus sp. Marseille-Q2685]|uniref:SH3 domain-containing protein n=1 Tax=Inquilinus sp. Marseille-Q2685 TaxID=2866581 RepID=UPI001CE42F68|nr:SH3 domain-containing protein [Inquilinus sp. Marseille-Q2685]